LFPTHFGKGGFAQIITRRGGKKMNAKEVALAVAKVNLVAD